jgi:hypothetical protein
VALSKATMLYVQGFDEQAGISIAWRDLDYTKVSAWLQRVLDLDPRGQYPLLAASEVYGAVSDPARARQMLDFVYANYPKTPTAAGRGWPMPRWRPSTACTTCRWRAATPKRSACTPPAPGCRPGRASWKSSSPKT